MPLRIRVVTQSNFLRILNVSVHEEAQVNWDSGKKQLQQQLIPVCPEIFRRKENYKHANWDSGEKTRNDTDL